MVLTGRLLIVAMLCVAGTLGCASSKGLDRPVAQAANKGTRVQVDGLSYLLLPNTYSAYMSRRWSDAVTGCFRPDPDSAGHAPKIDFEAGVVGSVSFKPEDFEWIRKDIGAGYGLKREGTLKVDLVTLHLSARVHDNQEIDIVLAIARSYTYIGHRCVECERALRAVGGRGDSYSTTYTGCDK
jgi:hypothetical protein